MLLGKLGKCDVSLRNCYHTSARLYEGPLIPTSPANDNDVRHGFAERDRNRAAPPPFAERPGLLVAFLGHINDARRQRQDGHQQSSALDIPEWQHFAAPSGRTSNLAKFSCSRFYMFSLRSRFSSYRDVWGPIFHVVMSVLTICRKCTVELFNGESRLTVRWATGTGLFDIHTRIHAMCLLVLIFVSGLNKRMTLLSAIVEGNARDISILRGPRRLQIHGRNFIVKITEGLYNVETGVDGGIDWKIPPYTLVVNTWKDVILFLAWLHSLCALKRIFMKLKTKYSNTLLYILCQTSYYRKNVFLLMWNNLLIGNLLHIMRTVFPFCIKRNIITWTQNITKQILLRTRLLNKRRYSSNFKNIAFRIYFPFSFRRILLRPYIRKFKDKIIHLFEYDYSFILHIVYISGTEMS